MHLSVVREVDVKRLQSSGILARYEEMCERFNVAFEETFCELEREEVCIDVVNGFGICELSFDRPSRTACCGIGSNHIVVQDDGRIASCPMTIREPSSVVASTDLVQSARATVSDWDPASRNNYTKMNSLDCQWYGVCTSGCPVTNERVFGVPFAVSPLHPFYVYVIPRFLVFYSRKLLQAAKKQGISDFAILCHDGVLI